MLSVTIQNFKCYKYPPTRFLFEPERLTLIDGVSGKGKSTILLSIYWCLYGGMRGAVKPLKDCSSNRDGSSSENSIPGIARSATGVLIVFQNIKRFNSETVSIKRMSAATSSLEVRISDKTLDPSASEAWIQREFGSALLWNACSFVRQGERNSLLSVANSERYSILNELTFGGGDDVAGSMDTDVYIERANEMVKTKKAEFLHESANLASLRDSHDTISQSVDLRLSDFLEFLEINGLPQTFVRVRRRAGEEDFSFYDAQISEYKKSLDLDHAICDRAIAKINDRNSKLESINTITTFTEEKIATVKDRLASFIEYERDAMKQESMTCSVSPDDSSAVVDYFMNRFITGGQNATIGLFSAIRTLSVDFSPIIKTLGITDHASLVKFKNNLEIVKANHAKIKSCFVASGFRDVSGEGIYTAMKNLSPPGPESFAVAVKGRINALVARRVEDLAKQIDLVYGNLKCVFEDLPPSVSDLIAPLPTGTDLNSSATVKEWDAFIARYKSKKSEINDIGEELDNGSDAIVFLKSVYDNKNEECTEVCPNCSASINLVDIYKKKFGLSSSEHESVLDTRVQRIREMAKHQESVDETISSYHKVVASLVDGSGDDAAISHLLPPTSEMGKLEALLKTLAAAEADGGGDMGLISSYHLMQEDYSNVEKSIKQFSKSFDEINVDPIPATMTVDDATHITTRVETLRNVKEGLDGKRRSIETQIEELDAKLRASLDAAAKTRLDFEKTPLMTTQAPALLAKYGGGGADVKTEFSTILETVGVVKTSLGEFERMADRHKMLNISNAKVFDSVSREKAAKAVYENSVKAQNVLQLVAREAVKHTADNIANVANEVLERLFDQEFFGGPMRISLELGFSGGKNTAAAPSSSYNTVSLYVIHRGARYDGYKLLSGGESDRLSIALTVALSIMSSSPFLFFDESMASLDENLRERCYVVMKEFARAKTVVNICHSSVEGFHDEVINL